VNKSYLLLASAIFVLSACSTVNRSSETEYLDLVGDKEAVENYWVVDRMVVPRYPVTAGKNGISGCVEFTLIIDVDGKPQNMAVIKSFPGSTFNKKAYEALRKWRWAPSASNTQKQPVLTTIQLDFTTKKSVNLDKAYKSCSF
jgi:protein TonB